MEQATSFYPLPGKGWRPGAGRRSGTQGATSTVTIKERGVGCSGGSRALRCRGWPGLALTLPCNLLPQGN